MISKRILRIIFKFSPVIAHSIECNLASDDYLKANCYGSHKQHIRDEMYRRKLLCIAAVCKTIKDVYIDGVETVSVRYVV